VSGLKQECEKSESVALSKIAGVLPGGNEMKSRSFFSPNEKDSTLRI
jgi:hypothetical protein